MTPPRNDTGPVERQVLVVFDIDGTLLASAGEHHVIMTEVLARSGLDVLAKPWTSYRNYTDSAVIDEVLEDARGRVATTAELDRFDAEYRAGLDAYLAGAPDPTGGAGRPGAEIVEIAGAGRLIADLEGLPGVHLAFATGSLRSMAVRKLALLGIDADRVVLATGSEHRTREGIVTAAVDAVRRREGTDPDVVILGDGVWDERTAVALGLPFVALETGPHRFGDVPVLTLTDFTGLEATALVSLARPLPPSWPPVKL